MIANLTMKLKFVRIFILFIVLISIDYNLQAQDGTLIDSLLNVARTTDNDSIRGVCYRRIAFNTYESDTVEYYANLGLEASMRAADVENQTKCLYCLAQNSYYNEKFNTSIYYLRRILEFAADDENGSYKRFEGYAYNLMATNYDLLHKTDSFQINMKKAVETFTELRDTFMIIDCLSGMGAQSSNSGLYTTAIDYYNQALAMSRTANFPDCVYRMLTEMADVCINSFADAPQERPEQLRFALQYAREAKLMGSDNVGDLTIILNNLTRAKAYQYLFERTSNVAYADSSSVAIAEGEQLLRNTPIPSYAVDFDILKAKQLLNNNQYRKALALLESDLETVRQESLSVAELNIYELLPQCYEKIGDFSNAYKAEHHLRLLKQNFQNEQKMRQSIEYQQQLIHEEEMRQIEIDRINREAELRRQRIVGIALICGLGLALSLIVVILRSLKEKKRTNELLAKQKDEITAQRDQLNETNKQITASINYAHLIQSAAISTVEEVRELFPESFVYYHPKNIVSGDWYRVARFGEYRILVVADCTGHGVPGAMLSMLGISALKEILADMGQRGQEPQPSEILNRMRKQIIESLAKSDDNNYHAEDGMDVAVLIFMPDKTKAVYAGAKQDLFLIRDGAAQRIKGDSMPIGRYVKENDFSQTEIELQNGDMIYLFSDGIKDQFGPSGKFLAKRQTAFFEEYASHPVDEQLETITKLITDWRADLVQTDDQTMVGVRVVM